MNISFEIDPETGDLMAIYIHIAEGEVSRTTEIAEGRCYADEDSGGGLIGIELLGEVHLKSDLHHISEKYGVTGLDRMVTTIGEAVHA
ncbi:MAG: hypothetical protein KC940_23395 [Candidatus Omnitrophica bacterium]|nr:hypothetical protein [Candidatus Omnitrophota bacterium]